MEQNVQHQLAATWFVLIAMVCFGMAFFPFSGFLPPLPATMTAQEVATYFKEHGHGIRFSMILLLEAGAFFSIIVALISLQIRRIEQSPSILTYTQLIAGAVGSAVIIIGGCLMTTVAFRPERPIEVTYLLYDLSWMFVIMPSTSYTLQFFATGLAILSDRRSMPLFPRWVGYYNIWTGLAIAPGLLIPYFHAGPFAWNGLISFWLGVVAFGGWFVIMFFALRRAIRTP